MIYRRVGQLFLVLLIFNSSTDFSCRALESDASQIQELCLSILPGFAGKYDLVILIPLLRLLTNLNWNILSSLSFPIFVFLAWRLLLGALGKGECGFALSNVVSLRVYIYRVSHLLVSLRFWVFHRQPDCAFAEWNLAELGKMVVEYANQSTTYPNHRVGEVPRGK